MSRPVQKTDAGLPAFVAFVERLGAWAGGVAACLLGLIATMMLAEVAARNLLNRSLHITWELSAWAMGALFFLAAASAMRKGDHVRVGILFEIMGARAARGLDLCATLAALAVAAYVAYALGGLTFRSFSGDVRSWSGYRMPLGIPQALLTLGAVLLALQLAARLVRVWLGLPGEVRDDDIPGPESGV